MTVLDPNKHPVPVSVDPLPGQGIGPLSFSFTPQVAGPHHVTAHFAPDFGDFETDVQIAADRTDAGLVERPMPFECVRFEISQGVDFCLDADGGQLTTLVGGQEVSRVDAWDFARAPSLSGVWVVADGGADQSAMRLYTLDGGALSLAFEQELPWSNEGCLSCGVPGLGREYLSLKARENRLLLLVLPQVIELTFDGGVLATNDLSPGFHLPLIIMAQWGPFGSVAGYGGDMACVLPWDAGVCWPMGSEPLAADSQLLWAYEPTDAGLSGFGLPLDGGEPIDVHLVMPMPDVSPLGRTLFRWSVGDDTAVVRFEGGQVSLEAFPLPMAGATHSGVEPARLWRWDPADGGTIRYVDR